MSTNEPVNVIVNNFPSGNGPEVHANPPMDVKYHSLGSIHHDYGKVSAPTDKDKPNRQTSIGGLSTSTNIPTTTTTIPNGTKTVINSDQDKSIFIVI